ncbi:MAG: sterol desaturase family protein [Desulfobacteraceae bacterium]|nr:sterol desaturase family protein [Desulfobacteraceae bacterium]MBC2757485.1 sterol desaturase family protein [Desulfobacteraceae bacterium]
MEDFFTEKSIRLISFVGILLIMGGWEILFQRKKLVDAKPKRWLNNLGLVAVDNLILQLGFVMLPVTFAAFAQSRGMGIFNQLSLPVWADWIATVIIFDFIIYLQHVLFHFVPILWRLHQVHHSDLDIDVTTAIRFHPIEIIISLFIKLAAIAAFGFPPEAVLLFEVLLNATAMFNHANIYIPTLLDKFIRLLIVTPDMHRVHHSMIMDESNTNFGFNLSVWDRICGTYQAQPAAGHDRMIIGLEYAKKPKSFIELLIMPFSKK